LPGQTGSCGFSTDDLELASLVSTMVWHGAAANYQAFTFILVAGQLAAGGKHVAGD
jgi:hypothetical protein